MTAPIAFAPRMPKVSIHDRHLYWILLAVICSVQVAVLSQRAGSNQE